MSHPFCVCLDPLDVLMLPNGSLLVPDGVAGAVYRISYEGLGALANGEGRMSAGRSLLAVHQGALGDLVVLFPVLLGLRAGFKRLELLCPGALGRLACGLGVAHHSRPLEAAAFATLYAASADAVVPEVKRFLERFDVVVLFSRSTHLEGIVRRLVRGEVHRIAPRPEASCRIHVRRHALNRLVGCGLMSSVTDDESLERGPRQARDRRGAHPNPRRIVIHPGSGSPQKCWPLARFGETARLLRREGFEPEFLLGPAEEWLEAEFPRAVSPPTVVHRLDDLTRVAALLAGAGGYIGNDSGITHLAAFVGLPTVVLFGPTDPVRWKPYGRAVAVVQPDSPCPPCFESSPTSCDGAQCLGRISVDRVWEALRGLGPAVTGTCPPSAPTGRTF